MYKNQISEGTMVIRKILIWSILLIALLPNDRLEAQTSTASVPFDGKKESLRARAHYLKTQLGLTDGQIRLLFQNSVHSSRAIATAIRKREPDDRIRALYARREKVMLNILGPEKYKLYFDYRRQNQQ